MPSRFLQNRYYLLARLGRGGFGVTYKAEDRSLPERPLCVIKQLKPAQSDPETLEAAQRLFKREAEVQRVLGQHDRIPELKDYFELGDEFYLVQEYIEGSNLDQEIVNGKTLSENYVLNLLYQVLEILEFIQQHHSIHRDINPSNLMRRMRDGKICLIDFGAVKQIVDPNVDFSTVAIGKPGYTPKEQMRGRPKFSSDIYALGMTAIQALTGIHPAKIPRDSQGNLCWQENIKIKPYLADIINKMIAYELRDRYQTATEVLDAIAQKESSSPVMVALPQPKPWFSRRWLAIAGTVLLVIALVILALLR